MWADGREVAGGDAQSGVGIGPVVVVELVGGEGLDAFVLDLLAAEARLARARERERRGASRHLVLAVGAGAGPHRHDHGGSAQAHETRDVAHEVASPTSLGLLGRQREVEVLEPEEVGGRDACEGQRVQLFDAPHQAEGAARLAAGGVAAAFAAGHGDDARAKALVERVASEGGEHAAVVVGVGAHEQHVDLHHVEAGDIRCVRGSAEGRQGGEQQGSVDSELHGRQSTPMAARSGPEADGARVAFSFSRAGHGRVDAASRRP